MSFQTWTVLPHDPIEKLTPGLWTVSGRMPKGNQRRMAVVRLKDGRLVVHNAMALDDPEMQQLDQWGEVSAIVVPNAFHRQDAFIWKQRYPKARVYCPGGAAKAVAKVVPVDGDYSGIPSDSVLRAEHLHGMKGAEGFLRVSDDRGVSVVFNDALLNMQPKGMLTNFFLSPVGVLSVPRFARLFWLKDRRAFVQQVERLAAEGVDRILVGHGDTISDDAAARLRDALARLG